MTETQRNALRAMAARNTGALLVGPWGDREGASWCWPETVRLSEDAARAVLARLAELERAGR